jgi:hypothetical protein
MFPEFGQVARSKDILCRMDLVRRYNYGATSGGKSAKLAAVIYLSAFRYATLSTVKSQLCSTK